MKRNRHLSDRKTAARFAGAALALSIALASPLTAMADDYQKQLEEQRAMTIETNLITDWPQGPVVTARSAILMEAETGTILYAKNIHNREYPASTTKLLTCLIAAETCTLDEMVTMSRSAVYDIPRGSNHIALDEGESITMEDALHAILIRSANEVSYAVGEHISGTTWQDFGPIMNERAVQLGCLNSNFVNPNGLPHDDHYTTAYDLAMIARAFFDNEMLAEISGKTRLEIYPSETQPDTIIENTKNQILSGQKYAYEYLIGSKTGYTDAARNCLVSCAEKDGLKLICVVLRDATPAQYEDTIALFDYGFSNFTAVNVSQIETKYNIDTTGLFYSDNDVFGSSRPLLSLNTSDYLVLPINASFEDTDSSISYETDMDHQAAVITYTWNGVEVGTASVDFAHNSDNSFSFDAPMLSTEEQAAPEPEDKPVLFVNVIKIALIVAATLLLTGIMLLILLHILRKRQKDDRHGGSRYAGAYHTRRRRRRRRFGKRSIFSFRDFDR